MTDRDKVVELLNKLGVEYNLSDANANVTLVVGNSHVVGYIDFTCEFKFTDGGDFIEVAFV